MAEIEFEIDGQTLKALPGQTVLQVADAAGIYIPRFCYHKHLSIAANCRMCIVEVEKSPKPLPACATPVTPGMKVFTKSPRTIAAQRAVMEFLLINHPLDCPICDQGGECELQDLSMGYGASHSAYDEPKRSVADQDLGPLIASDMTRCIYCTRCVRFGDEIAGLREMGLIGRGEDTEVGTYVTHAVKSEVSGNIIDLCPVGALTSKPYRFRARPWELDQNPSVAPHDCLGTNIFIHTRYGKVMRVVSRENKAINETWIADRDRFSYTALTAPDRLTEPKARINGKWETVSWEKAFELTLAGLQKTLTEFGSDQLGALASPSATVEEFYLLQKIIRGLGSPHIDHRLRECDTKDQAEWGAYPSLGLSLPALEACDEIILIGSNLRKEQPLASLRVRKAVANGATVHVVNPVDYQLNFKVADKKIVSPALFVETLAQLLNDEKSSANAQGEGKKCILLGALALHHPEASTIRYLAQQLANAKGAALGFLTSGANSAGGWLAGCIPHRGAAQVKVETGLSAYEMLKNPRKAYVLLNVEPEYDLANAALAQAALQRAQFTVALSVYHNPVLEAHAHVILPMAPFTETSGTFVNALGEWQSMRGVAKTEGSARPAWKILRVLGNFLQLEGFEYESSEEIKRELKEQVEKMPAQLLNLSAKEINKSATTSLTRIGEVPIYAIDSLVRRAKPLQVAGPLMEGEQDVLRLHPETAKKWQVKEGDKVKVTEAQGEAKLTVKWDGRIAEGAAYIAAGIVATRELGDLFGEVSIQLC